MPFVLIGVDDVGCSSFCVSSVLLPFWELLLLSSMGKGGFSRLLSVRCRERGVGEGGSGLVLLGRGEDVTKGALELSSC